MATTITKHDLLADALYRLIEQYKDSPNLLAVIALIMEQAQELHDAQWDLLEAFDLETATGWALDVLGNVVGLPRPIIDAGIFDYFGFTGAPGALGWGTTSDPGEGGVWASVFSETSGFVAMEDEMYRLNIKAKVLRNKGSATDEDILEIVRIVFPGAGSATTVEQDGDAGYELTVGRPLTNIEQALLDIEDLNGQGDQLIPRAAGVDATYTPF